MQEKIDDATMEAKKEVQAAYSKKEMSEEDIMKAIARDRQLMLDATVNLVVALYGRSQANVQELQAKHDK